MIINTPLRYDISTGPSRSRDERDCPTRARERRVREMRIQRSGAIPGCRPFTQKFTVVTPGHKAIGPAPGIVGEDRVPLIVRRGRNGEAAGVSGDSSHPPPPLGYGGKIDEKRKFKRSTTSRTEKQTVAGVVGGGGRWLD